MRDSFLRVGYEESTGTVISVGGARVLGIRGAYTPPIIAAKKKFATASGEYERGVAKGYAECKRGISAEYIPHGSADFRDGFKAGWAKCRPAPEALARYNPPPAPSQAVEHPSSAWDDSRLRHGGLFGIVKEEPPPPPPPPPEIARRPSAAWDDGRIRPPGQLGIVKEEPPPPPPPPPERAAPAFASYHRWQIW